MDQKIKIPFNISIVGAFLGLLESISTLYFYKKVVEISPMEIEPLAIISVALIGLIISISLLTYLYYLNKKGAEKDNFLWIIAGSLLGILFGGMITHIITLIGGIICYRRL